MIDPASPTPKKCGQVKLYILFAAILLSTIPAPFPATASEDPELVTNATVRELHEIGFGEEVILEKILNTQCEFAVDIDSLKQLKEAGVPSRVIAEMISTQSKATPSILAQFKTNKKKNNRQLVVAKISAWGSVESGAID